MRTLMLSLVLPALVHAQEARPVNCRFLSFGGTEDMASVLATGDKGAEIACPLPTRELSPKVVCFAKNNAIGFLSSTDRKPAATALVPAGVRDAILVFIGDPKKKPEPGASAWRVFVIEDSPKNFPDGGVFVANFYHKDIRFVIGDHKGMLRAAGSHGYAKPGDLDSFNMGTVVFEFRQEESWEVASESALRFLPGVRYLILAHVDPFSARPRVNTYQDIASAVKAN